MKPAVAGLILLGTSFAFAQPDPRDSIILESKAVAPGLSGSPAFTIKVYITNKDSLSGLILPLIESSFSGGAYATLAHPRTFGGVITPLTGNFISGAADFNFYHSDSPDTFFLSGYAGTIKPPNSTRQAVWEIKFDTIKPRLGCFELDSIAFPPNVGIGFVNQKGRSVAVNFIKSRMVVSVPGRTCCSYFVGFPPPPPRVPAGDTLRYHFGLPCPGEWAFSVVSGPGSIDSTGLYTVPPQCQAGEYPFTFQVTGRPNVPCDCDSIKTNQYAFTFIVDPPAKGDLNCDFGLSPADVVWILNCVMLGKPPPAGMAACDLNCDGQASPADIVLELNAVYLAQPPPC